MNGNPHNPSDSSESHSSDLFVQACFPTLVFKQKIPNSSELNAALVQYILAERQVDKKGLQISNVAELGGWHSRNTLYKDEVFSPLVDAIGDMASAVFYRLDYDPELRFSLDQMWAVVNPPGAFNRNHTHPHSLWSGVYYVQVPEHSGTLFFDDPRPGHVMFPAMHRAGVEKPDEAKLTISCDPVEGQLVLFPGFLSHSVEVNQSANTGDAALRVAVSFNLAQH